MKAETLSRQENQNKRRLKAAGFPYLKTLEEFDCTQLNDAVSPLFLQELASCQFIQNRQNIVMIGNPGRGKTHLSIALGLKACTQGYRVLFKNAATLSTELCEAKDNYHLGKLERTLAKADLLILDELSYLSFNRHQSELLCTSLDSYSVAEFFSSGKAPVYFTLTNKISSSPYLSIFKRNLDIKMRCRQMVTSQNFCCFIEAPPEPFDGIPPALPRDFRFSFYRTSRTPTGRKWGLRRPERSPGSGPHPPPLWRHPTQTGR